MHDPVVVEIRLFGGVGATSDRGEPVDVGPAKSQTLLATLALSVGSAVPVPRLVAMLWGEQPPRTAEKTLQSYVARLRKSLGPGSIIRTGAAYRLDLDPDVVDVRRFQRLLAAGDVDAALVEWTGTPLAGLDTHGLTAAVDALVEQWLGATELDLSRRVESDAASVVGALTELTADHPFREGLWALLMTALWRVGRQADALAAYRRARRHLVEELGVEPGPRLRALEAAILGHDEQRIVQLGAGDLPPRRGVEPRRGNLPRRLGRLVGRDDDLAVVVAALATSPAVTLVGPGGIGKTRLALAAARRVEADVAGGAWLVELAGIAASSDAAQAVATVLDVKTRPGQSTTEAIVSTLQPGRDLLVLDNCEHVIDGVAALARAVVGGCPHVRVLATSREGLGLGHGHEQLVAVGPLEPTGPAVELFDERAGAITSGYDPQAHRAAVVAICRRLDGVPLAIELVAARTSSLSPSELADRLDHRLLLLTGGRRASIERHRTLRATIDWSYDLLTPSEQHLFQCLAIFTGPFDLPAAETVAGDTTPDLASDRAGGPAGNDAGGAALDPGEVDDLLGSLVDRSMVIVESGPFGRRFRLLETMRQYAAEHLSTSGHTDVVAGNHARWCRDRVEGIGRLLAGPTEVEGVARLDELWPNLRAAVEWACTTGDRHLVHGLLRPIAPEVYVRSRSEIADWAERPLATTPPDDAELVAFGVTWAARRSMRHLDGAGFQRLVDRYGEPDDPMVRYARGFIHVDRELMAESARQAVADLRKRGEDAVADLFEIAALGVTLLMTGRLAEADDLLFARAEHHRRHGPPTCLSWALTQLALSASLQGRHRDAWQLFDEAAHVVVPARTHTLKNPFDARAALRRGDRPGAFRLLRAYVDEIVDQDNLFLATLACVEFVNLTTEAGNHAEAATIVTYLDTTGALAPTLPWHTLLAPTHPKPTREDNPRTPHQALKTMQTLLTHLAAAPDG